MITLATYVLDVILQISVRFPRLGRVMGVGLSWLPFVRKADRRRLAEMAARCNKEDKMVRLGRIIARLSPRSRRVLIRNFFSYRLRNTNVTVGGQTLRFPRVLVTFVTNRCNLSCPYCFSKDYSLSHMDDSLLRKALREASDHGTIFVCIAGGEPMARKDLLQLLAEYPKLLFFVFTNGILIDERAVEIMARAGNIAPMFSLDGWQPTTDAQRKSGTWASIETAMARLNENRLPFGFSSHLDGSNFEQVYSSEFVEEMVERGAICGWYSHHIPNNVADYQTQILTPEQRVESLNRCETFKREFPIFLVDSAADPRYVGGCPSAGYLMASVDSNGNICPCPFIPFAAGNLKDMTITEALASSLFQRTRALGKVSQTHDHVAGCIALDKRNEMLEIAESEPSVAAHGGSVHLAQWDSMREAHADHMKRFHEFVEREVVFWRSEPPAETNQQPDADQPSEQQPGPVHADT